MSVQSATSRLRALQHLLQQRTARQEPSIPVGRGAVPLLGHALRLARDPLRFLTSLSSGGGLVRIRLGPNAVVLVCDPELTHQVLVDDQTFDKGGPLVDLVSPLVGDGLATCPRSRHRRPRRLLQPLFQPDRLQNYAVQVTAAVTSVVGDWRDGHALDIPVEMRRLSARVAVRTMFSGSLPLTVTDQLADDFTSMLVGSAQRLSRPPVLNLLPTPTNRHYYAGLKRARQTVADAIVTRRADGGNYNDVLTRLLASAEDGEAPLDDTAILDHAITFLIAPTATVASVLGWTLHMLAQQPDLQDRLQAEVDAVLDGSPAGFEHLAQLQLTQRIVAETLRLYPSLWFAPLRQVTTDTVLGGHKLPAGTTVAFSPYVVHTDKERYDNPERFDPDRWDRTLHPERPRHAFIPFGEGARQCIAKDFAVNEMVLALATIASRWRLVPVPGSPLPTHAAVNLTVRGLRLRTVLRTSPGRDQRRGSVAADDSAAEPRIGNRRPTRRKAWLI